MNEIQEKARCAKKSFNTFSLLFAAHFPIQRGWLSGSTVNRKIFTQLKIRLHGRKSVSWIKQHRPSDSKVEYLFSINLEKLSVFLNFGTMPSRILFHTLLLVFSSSFPIIHPSAPLNEKVKTSLGNL